MIKKLAHLFAAGVALPLILSSVSAQNYRIRLDPIEKVGERYLLRATSRVNTKTTVAVEGQFLRSSEDGFSLHLFAKVMTLAINKNNWATRKSFVILNSSLTKGSASRPVLPEGTVVLASIENGKTTYRAKGKPLDEEITSALGSVISLHISEVGDDDMYGTSARKNVGESWPVRMEATGRVLKEIGVENSDPKIQGTTTLEKVEKNRLFVRGTIDVRNVLLPMATGITTEAGEIDLELAGAFPLLRSDLNRDVSQRIHMSSTGTTAPGEDGKRATVRVIYESRTSFEIRPLRR